MTEPQTSSSTGGRMGILVMLVEGSLYSDGTAFGLLNGAPF